MLVIKMLIIREKMLIIRKNYKKEIFFVIIDRIHNYYIASKIIIRIKEYHYCYMKNGWKCTRKIHELKTKYIFS